MFPLSTLVMIAIAALIIGGVLGVILVKALHPDEQENRELEDRLKKAEDQLKTYQHEITEHFTETSQLVNKLTQSYKEVHEYLAESALKLTTPDMSRQLIDAGDGKLLTHDTNQTTGAGDDSAAEAPRDWAPRSPSGKGQLSEDFGHEQTTDDGASKATS